MSVTEFDVCVIGTGAGGGVMIDQLTAAGFRVVALEQVTGAAKVQTIWGGEQ
jgi:choline dehydrogenase-like flavoprotein